MARVMTKRQVISRLAGKAGVQKKAAAVVLKEFIALATRERKKGERLVIPGSGNAVKASRKARIRRNPLAGEPLMIAAKAVAKFRLTKAFKDSVVPPKAHRLDDADELFSTLEDVFSSL
jgi:DNA-binding protein HU-beta